MKKAVLFFILAMLIPPALSAEEAVNGILDLRKVDFVKNPVIALLGEWEFEWGKYLEPGRAGSIIKRVPGTWDRGKNEDVFDPQGYGSYRLNILLPTNTPELSLYVPYFSNSFAVFANGKKIIQNGNLDTALPASMEPRFRPSPVSFTLKEGSALELLIHVSNFQDKSGGLPTMLRLGAPEIMNNNQKVREFINVFLFATLVIIGFYHISFYFFRRNESSPLYFGLFSLILGFREILYNEHLLLWLFPKMSFELENTLGYISFYLAVPLFVGYINALFNNSNKGKLLKNILWIAALLFSALTLIFDHRIYVEVLLIYQIIAGITGFYILGLVIYRSFQGDWFALTSLLGVFALVGTMINDALYAQLIISTGHYSPIAVLFFIFSQAVLLSWRFSQAFKQSQILGKELAAVNTSLRRFVPEEFLRFLGRKKITDVMLGDHVERRMTILFADIRGFTRISEDMDPQSNFSFLNTYLAVMSPIIKKHGGFIDKYIGDAIMALFPGTAENALRCAIEMQQQLSKYNQRSKLNLQIGIGIHTGDLMLGTIGDESRMDSTVISDAVNICSRIDEIARDYELNIVISKDTKSQLENPEAFKIRYIGDTPLKGKSREVGLFDVMDGDEQKVLSRKYKSAKVFHAAVDAYYKKEYENAHSLFREILKTYPEDGCSLAFLKKLQRLKHAGVL
jgi:adenylate cyclase